MTNSEYKPTEFINDASVNTANTHQKQINSNSISSIIEDTRRSNFREHNLLIYPDLPSFRQIYSECTKQALDNNEIVFLATTYDSFNRIEDALKSKGVSVEDDKNYEQSVTKKIDLKLKAICSYHRDNFGMLAEEQQRVLLSSHNTLIGVKD
jgi:hypothetical protein